VTRGAASDLCKWPRLSQLTLALTEFIFPPHPLPLKCHEELGVKHKGIADGRPWHFLPVPMCLDVYINAIHPHTYVALKSLVLSKYAIRPSLAYS
jgi:hypothetical protein